ncbi:MAG: ABC transporter substrate-binding protein [Mucilaginibacter polytrichastri]|nr:ABC transporter substrate-binding protein [Mucilaginibacter polytrichastri]
MLLSEQIHARIQLFSPFIFLCFGLFILPGCAHKDPDHGKSVFYLNLDQGLTSLDPAFARNQNVIWMTNQIFDGLVRIDDRLNVKPSVAKSWSVSADGRTYTFRLRNDVFFHDDPVFPGEKGRRAVAGDVAYSFRRLIDPKTASSGSWIFSDKVDPGTAFRAPDDSTFVLQLLHPFPPLMRLLTAQYCSIVPHEAVEKYGKDFRAHPVGTGPFRFKVWNEGEVLVLLKNPHYWERENGRALPYLDAVKVSFVADKQTAFMEFVKHNLDFYNSIDGSYRDDILTKSGKITRKYRGRFRYRIGPYLNTQYIGMLVDSTLPIVKHSPLRYKKVRQALNYAIDRKKMVKYLRNSVGSAATSGFIPEGMPGFSREAVHGYTYDPERARRLLQEAGFPDGKGMPALVLHTSAMYKDVTEYVQGELSAIGVPCRIEVSQSASLRELIAKNGVNFFRAEWIADYADGENYLSMFYSKNKIPFGPNYTSFFNKTFDRMFEQAQDENNDAKRFRLYHAMDSLVISEAPVMPLYYDRAVNLFQNTIDGLSRNPQNLLVLKRVQKQTGR